MERHRENENSDDHDAKKGGTRERGGIHSLSDAKILSQKQERFKTTTKEEEGKEEEDEHSGADGDRF